MLLKVLEKGTTGDVPVPKAIITVGSTQNPRDAFKKLVDNNIRSAPVWNSDDGEYCGFIDIRDLITFVVYDNNEAELQKLAAHTGCTEFIDHMLKVGASMYDQPIEGCTLQYLSRRHKFHSVQDGASLEEVAKLLSIKGCHRVPVLDANGKITKIISQSTIIQFLHDHGTEMAELGAHTVARAMCGTSPVVSIKTTDTVLDAFKEMSKNDIMGIAVIDEHGKFVGNTSASDIKEFLIAPNSTRLNMSILEFLNHVRQRNMKSIHPAISVAPNDSLAYVIAKLAATKIHRIFVIDSGKLHSVISLGDILNYVYLTTKLKGDA